MAPALPTLWPGAEVGSSPAHTISCVPFNNCKELKNDRSPNASQRIIPGGPHSRCSGRCSLCHSKGDQANNAIQEVVIQGCHLEWVHRANDTKVAMFNLACVVGVIRIRSQSNMHASGTKTVTITISNRQRRSL